MMSRDNEDQDPSWLDTDKDEIHRKEVEPLLFGTGKVTLTDPDESDDNDDAEMGSEDGSSKSKKKKNGKGYGSTESGTESSPNRASLWTMTTPVTSFLNKGEDSNDDVFDFNDQTDGSKQGDDADKSGVMDENTFHEKTGRPREPSRHWIVRFFFAIQTFGMMTNLALFVSQILPIVFHPTITKEDMTYLALKIYLCVFSIIFLIVEFDHPSIPFLRKASFLKTFASRGFLYTFLGLVCFDEANSEAAHEALKDKEESLIQVPWFALFNEAAAWSLVGLGVLYFLMGIVCLQKVRNRYVYDDRQKWKAHREALGEWDQSV